VDSKKTINFKLTTTGTAPSVGLAGATELCIEYVEHKNRTAGHDHAGRKSKENEKSGTDSEILTQPRAPQLMDLETQEITHNRYALN
jgi:hypothetical protein